MRKRKGMTDNDRCGLCHEFVEDSDHVFRFSSFSIMVWRRIGNARRFSRTVGLSLLDWVKGNVLNHDLVDGISTWGVLFLSTLWGLWKARCKHAM